MPTSLPQWIIQIGSSLVWTTCYEISIICKSRTSNYAKCVEQRIALLTRTTGTCLVNNNRSIFSLTEQLLYFAYRVSVNIFKYRTHSFLKKFGQVRRLLNLIILIAVQFSVAFFHILAFSFLNSSSSLYVQLPFHRQNRICELSVPNKLSIFFEYIFWLVLRKLVGHAKCAQRTDQNSLQPAW